MSIHPRFAEAILSGAKGIEFRKRRLAPDVSTVLIYATRPVGMVVGVFEIAGYDIDSASALWDRHRHHAGIARREYRDYYRGSRRAIGILVRDNRALARPLALDELDPALTAPQSFRYLELAPWPIAMIPELTADGTPPIQAVAVP
jgi:predicted transcriptional regulator